MTQRRPVILALSLFAACSSSAPAGPTAGGGGTNATGDGGGTSTGGAPVATGGAGGSSGGAGGSSGGAGGSGGTDGATSGGPADAARPVDAAGPVTTEKFSFFLTSLEGMRRLSKSQDGFGGDLRYGQATGLAGADKICADLAEFALPGAGGKGWRAFLSVPALAGNPAVDAIDRIGEGPWYDRKGRLVAMTRASLLNARPMGADPAIINDLPNEYGVPNHRPDPDMPAVDNHHFLTGSNEMGRLYGPTATCNGWTVRTGGGRPRIGFSWPEGGREHWISGQDEGGCGAGVNVRQTGGSDPGNPIVGSGGGYGGIYCFALQP